MSSGLTAAFVAHLPRQARGLAATTDLELKLEALLGRARADFPRLVVGDDAFLRFVAERASGPLDELPAGELLLACASASGQAAALEALEERYFARLAPSIARVDASPAFADEVRQVLREKLFVAVGGAAPRHASFTGQGPLLSWLRAAAVRTALNLKRPGRREESAEDEALEVLPLAGPDPELALMREHHRPVFQAAFRGALAELSARERTLIKLQTLDGLSLERIGAIYGVNKSTVSRWSARALELLVDGTRRRVSEQLSLDTGELESLLRLVRSGLELSVSALLDE